MTRTRRLYIWARHHPRITGATVATVLLLGLIGVCSPPPPQAPTAATPPTAPPTAAATTPAAAWTWPQQPIPQATAAEPAAPDTATPDTATPATDADAPDATPGPPAYYATCAQARAAGAAPLYVGEPGYRTGLDRDGDGKACDS